LKRGIETPSTEQRVVNPSGGNQQKIVIAKWVAYAPKALIVDEPTRGIDIGPKPRCMRCWRASPATG
jgi:ribose transport system ATP-binding protein